MKIDINVPDGESGEWKVKTIVVPEPDALQKARAALRDHGRIVPAGTYKILYRNREVIMSNTPDEIRDFMGFVNVAKGRVLVNGLGLGVLLQALIDKPEVEQILVVEISEDVIKLVAPTYNTNPKVTIIQADAFGYIPPKGLIFDYVWHDIWDTLDSENLVEMSKLHRKYAKKTKHQDSWDKSICLQMRRESQAEEKYYQLISSLHNPINVFDNL